MNFFNCFFTRDDEFKSKSEKPNLKKKDLPENLKILVTGDTKVGKR
jgi:hypothetical protein